MQKPLCLIELCQPACVCARAFEGNEAGEVSLVLCLNRTTGACTNSLAHTQASQKTLTAGYSYPQQVYSTCHIH